MQKLKPQAEILVNGKKFKKIIPGEYIRNRVKEMGFEISRTYQGKKPVLIGVLNGAFIFMSDLCKQIDLLLEVTFVQIKSYEGMTNSENLTLLKESDINLEGRHVIVVEDIIDTGQTLSFFMEKVYRQKPASVKIYALLVKKQAIKYPVVGYVAGFEIGNEFVIGYGLDYNGVGRNLESIYQLADS